MSARTRLIAGPFNRVEGDLEIRLEIEDGRVVDAFANSPLFRGFEVMLRGKDPRDALTLTPRICGICSVSQSAAASRALADVQGIAPTEAGGYATAIIHAVENLADHLTHFNLFFMPDFARPTYRDQPWYDRMVIRFTAAKGAAVRGALEARAQLLHIMGILAGKWPHTLAIQPGGVTKAPDARDKVRILATIRNFRAYLERELFGCSLETVIGFDNDASLKDWQPHHRADMSLFLDAAETLNLEYLGRGPDRFLSYGAYETAEGHLFARGLISEGKMQPVLLDRIVEDTAYAWMKGGDHHPFEGVTEPDPDMKEPAYSWCKAPRLDGGTVEVGALARQIIDGHRLARSLGLGGAGVRARVVGRLLEIARTVPALERWAIAMRPGEPYLCHGQVPQQGKGMGLVEAARGSLGHWLVLENGRIANYQIVAPTTWNFSPRDGSGSPGPVEQALIGAPAREGESTPIAVQHIVRSFDPCMVCTVH